MLTSSDVTKKRNYPNLRDVVDLKKVLIILDSLEWEMLIYLNIVQQTWLESPP